MSDSNLHVPEDVSTLLVSGQGYGIKGNRYLQYPAGTPLSNLQLTMLDRMGFVDERFGDSNGELTTLAGV